MFDLRHFLSDALSLARLLRRASESQGLEGDVRAGLEVRGHMLSREDVKVEHSMSVAVFKSSEERWLLEGSKVVTMEEKCEGERKRRLRRKEMEGGESEGGEGREIENWIKKWSEVWRGLMRRSCVVQLRVRMRSSCLPALWVAGVVNCLRSNVGRRARKSAACGLSR